MGKGEFEFRKVKFRGEDEAVSFPINEEGEFDTIGYYRNKPDGTQEFLDELTQEEMAEFRAQDDFEEVLKKLS